MTHQKKKKKNTSDFTKLVFKIKENEDKKTITRVWKEVKWLLSISFEISPIDFKRFFSKSSIILLVRYPKPFQKSVKLSYNQTNSDIFNLLKVTPPKIGPVEILHMPRTCPHHGQMTDISMDEHLHHEYFYMQDLSPSWQQMSRKSSNNSLTTMPSLDSSCPSKELQTTASLSNLDGIKKQSKVTANLCFTQVVFFFYENWVMNQQFIYNYLPSLTLEEDCNSSNNLPSLSNVLIELRTE